MTNCKENFLFGAVLCEDEQKKQYFCKLNIIEFVQLIVKPKQRKP